MWEERNGKGSLDLLKKLKAGQKSIVETIKEEKVNELYKKGNLDLITWLVVSYQYLTLTKGAVLSAKISLGLATLLIVPNLKQLIAKEDDYFDLY